MSDFFSSIKTPLEVDLNNFTTIALVGVSLNECNGIESTMSKCAYKKFK